MKEAAPGWSRPPGLERGNRKRKVVRGGAGYAVAVASVGISPGVVQHLR